jgi:hypothetical protein
MVSSLRSPKCLDAVADQIDESLIEEFGIGLHFQLQRPDRGGVPDRFDRDRDNDGVRIIGIGARTTLIGDQLLNLRPCEFAREASGAPDELCGLPGFSN